MIARDPTPSRRYSLVAIAFHWLIALLILFNLYLGWSMDHWATGMSKFSIFQLHKSIGITVLALSVLRLLWRLTHKAPPFPATMQAWERTAASVTHWTFYALMIVLPFTGWIVVSASPLNIPTLLFKTVPLPHLGFVHDQPIGTRTAIDHGIGTTHLVLAYIFGALILIHIAAALKHQFIQRDGVLRRMLP
ncbi:cytochrome b561 [Sphingomonas vulcanisoli]|uniref:Cytochrome b561 n=1 Tax=Sphingomonas vulcanisoli TaxID=1658060 RepID=A0ABX0TVD2_9SPHN|nr:cytochrome b [Sphingomonas vulcanisoli]NIJ09496.1 cytochrome b561 [Sphingomonas vulcanisoli]